jgi:hypothetical protein
MTRTLATFFVVAAMVALLAPVAPAGSAPRPVRPDDRGGLLGVGAVQATNAGAPATRRPDVRHVPDAADVPPVVVRIEPQPRDGFDWSAALLGAGAAAGLALVLAGSLVVMRTRTAGALQ